MTDNDNTPREIEIEEVELDTWMARLIEEGIDDVVVPRELMWARIRKERVARAQVQQQRQLRRRQVMLATTIAATLVMGIGIGRMSSTLTSPAANDSTTTLAVHAQRASESSPVRVAMNEHLVKTATLLASVGAQSPDERPRADIAAWSQELLYTTRLLLDSPELAAQDDTRRLLEDLEVVLMQIIQSRGTAAPEARRAPSETMLETNLLPRVRAAVTTASTSTGDFTLGGASE